MAQAQTQVYKHMNCDQVKIWKLKGKPGGEEGPF
jgi:hypothetical protein